MQPDQQNPYSFILNDQSGQKPPTQFGSDSGGSARILKAVLFLTGVVVVLIIGFSVITSIGKTNNEDLVSVLAYQTELDRVIELGKKESTDITLKNDLASLQAALASDQNELTTLLEARAVKVSKESLASKKDSKIDSTLESSKLNNTYDEALRTAMKSLAGKYVDALRTALSDTASANETTLLETAGNNIVTYSASPL